MWNKHNTVFGSKAICAQTVYFLHSTMTSVTWLRLSDISVICRNTYLQFWMQACFSSMSVSQAAQRRSWFTQYRTSDSAKTLGRSVSCTEHTARKMILNLFWPVKIGNRHPVEGSLGSEFPAICNHCVVMADWTLKSQKLKFCENFFSFFFLNDSLR